MIWWRLILPGLVLAHIHAFAQQKKNVDPCAPPATIIVFRSFNLISLALSYKLYAGDSLLGRMNTHKVFIIETYDSTLSLHATIKAPSFNSSQKSNYTKVKKINYPFSLLPGKVYLVKCGFLNQDVFNQPRQPTIRLLKGAESKRYLKRPFIKKKVKRYLFEEMVRKNAKALD